RDRAQGLPRASVGARGRGGGSRATWRQDARLEAATRAGVARLRARARGGARGPRAASRIGNGARAGERTAAPEGRHREGRRGRRRARSILRTRRTYRNFLLFSAHRVSCERKGTRLFHRWERPWFMETIVPLLIVGTFVAMLVIERVFPGRPLP